MQNPAKRSLSWMESRDSFFAAMWTNSMISLLSLALALVVSAQEPSRLAVNDKKAPSDETDLRAISDAIKRVLPSVKSATVCLELGEGSGSGVIVSADGLILTAAHVSGGVGKKITAILADGRKVSCESLGLSSESDCAMAQIIDRGSYPFVDIDRTDSTKLGDWVFSLGHSGGYDAARGVGVRIGRLVKIADRTLQSDCTLIGGDSGGPLFDLNGRLIGIHSRVGENLRVNMHVPMREFLRNWDEMKQSQFLGDGPFAPRPSKGSGFLGLGTEEISGGGLRVTQIGRESPAESSGIKVGDMLIKMDDLQISDKASMQNYLKTKAAGEMVRLVFKRDGKDREIVLRLAEKSSP